MTELLLHERQARIQELLDQTGRVLASELADIFGFRKIRSAVICVRWRLRVFASVSMVEH